MLEWWRFNEQDKEKWSDHSKSLQTRIDGIDLGKEIIKNIILIEGHYAKEFWVLMMLLWVLESTE